MRTSRPELYRTRPNPIELAVIARGLVRYRRPVVEKLKPPTNFPSDKPEVIYTPYDIALGVTDALEKAHIGPGNHLALLNETQRVALLDFPNYDEILQRRQAEADRLNSAA